MGRTPVKGRSIDKRVFDVRASLVGAEPSSWRVVAVSADATLPQFYRALQGAFEWTKYVMDARFEFDGAVYEGARGSRTLLRRIFNDGAHGTLTLFDETPHTVTIDIERSYDVRSRRHYPKVLDGDGPGARGYGFDARVLTYFAQEMAHAIVEQPRAARAPQPAKALSPSLLRGLFSCMAVGPLVSPGEWMRLAFDGSRDPGELLNVYNNVVDEVNADAIPRAHINRDWCEGFMLGVTLRTAEWQRAAADARFREGMDPIVDGYSTASLDVDAIARGISKIRAWWRGDLQPTRPKTAINDPCSCGSGKPYKYCCSPLRLLER